MALINDLYLKVLADAATGTKRARVSRSTR